jgi:hypothetical protein
VGLTRFWPLRLCLRSGLRQWGSSPLATIFIPGTKVPGFYLLPGDALSLVWFFGKFVLFVNPRSQKRDLGHPASRLLRNGRTIFYDIVSFPSASTHLSQMRHPVFFAKKAPFMSRVPHVIPGTKVPGFCLEALCASSGFGGKLCCLQSQVSFANLGHPAAQGLTDKRPGVPSDRELVGSRQGYGMVTWMVCECVIEASAAFDKVTWTA